MEGTSLLTGAARTVARAILPRPLRQKLRRPDPLHELTLAARGDALTSYSQEGEDLLLYNLLGLNEGMTPGFYVDVGAHHPSHYSNTLFFYLRGWRGINVDAMPGSMEAFRQMRPHDVNVEEAVSDVPAALTYYRFNESALNGFSKELAEERHNFRNFRLLSEQTIQTRTLAEILERHLPAGQTIDFLSVDVEGLDFQVLKSNDWERHRPGIVLVEDSEMQHLTDVTSSRIVAFMREQGYLPCCKTRLTLFFIEAARSEISPIGLRLAPRHGPANGL